MIQSLYALAFLACPVGMGLMMWVMMRGSNKNQPETDEASMHKQAELARMQAEIDQLRADKERGDAGAVRQPTP